MTNFHISQVDGMVRQCNAKSPETCTADTPPEVKEHFTNKADAEKAYEKAMEESAQPQKLTKLREDKFAKKREEIVSLEDHIAAKQKSDGVTDAEAFQRLQKAKRELRIAERDNAQQEKLNK